MPLILASRSVARQTMLRQAGLDCAAQPSGVDEAALKAGFAGPPAELAAALAHAKAKAVAAQNPGAMVLGADQILLCDGKLYDKPADLAEAAAHLRAFSGRPHQLISAACIVQNGQTLWIHGETATLSMRPLSDAFIQTYLAAEQHEILHCVGAYRLEGPGAQLFSHIEGDYFTILGLPLLPLLAFLRSTGTLPG